MEIQQPASPEQQKKGLIILGMWLILLLGITVYLLIDQPAPVQWLIEAVSDDRGTYSPKVVGGIVFIVVAIVTYPIALLLSNTFLKEKK